MSKVHQIATALWTYTCGHSLVLFGMGGGGEVVTQSPPPPIPLPQIISAHLFHKGVMLELCQAGSVPHGDPKKFLKKS